MSYKDGANRAIVPARNGDFPMANTRKQNDTIRKYVADRIIEMSISPERLADLLGVEPFKTDDEYYIALRPFLYLTGRARSEVKRAKMSVR